MSAPVCIFKGIVIDRCTKFIGGICVRCGKRRGQ
jgi:hypothetical protein